MAESRFFETPAFPQGAGADFVNAALLVETSLSPEALLARLHAVEAAHGRERLVRWGPRTLDLDLLAYGQAILPDRDTWQHWANLPHAQQAEVAPEQLILPHPRLAERGFVLVPLLDVAPRWRHPVSGLTVAEMAARLPAAERASIKPLS